MMMMMMMSNVAQKRIFWSLIWLLYFFYGFQTCSGRASAPVEAISLADTPPPEAIQGVVNRRSWALAAELQKSSKRNQLSHNKYRSFSIIASDVFTNTTILKLICHLAAYIVCVPCQTIIIVLNFLKIIIIIAKRRSHIRLNSTLSTV